MSRRNAEKKQFTTSTEGFVRLGQTLTTLALSHECHPFQPGFVQPKWEALEIPSYPPEICQAPGEGRARRSRQGCADRLSLPQPSQKILSPPALIPRQSAPRSPDSGPGGHILGLAPSLSLRDLIRAL